MPIDTSIYGMVQNPKMAMPFDTMQQALTIKGLVDQNAMRPQMQQLAMQKQQGDLSHQQAMTGKATADTHAQNVKISRDLLAAAASQADVDVLKEHVARTYGPQAASQIPNFDDPNFQSQRAQKIMDADAMLKRISPQLQSVDTGGAVERRNPYTDELVSTIPKTPTPEQSLHGGQGKPPAGYRFMPDGSLEAIKGGPADQKAQAKSAGGETVSNVIASLRDSYDQLEKSGGITSTENSMIGNLSAAGASSGIGQGLGKMFGTGNQSLRNTIAQQRPILLQAIMKATGMSAKQMDSNAELKLYLSTATDPTLDVQANKRALDMLEKLYGLGNEQTVIPKTSVPPTPKPGGIKFLGFE